MEGWLLYQASELRLAKVDNARTGNRAGQRTRGGGWRDARGDEPAAQAGEAEFPAMLTQSVIAIWHEFVEHRDLMRFPVEAKKFFAEGIWRRQ